jgi:hypothetical protein
MKWPSWAWVATGVKVLAPIPLTTSAAALAFILWRGGWAPETAQDRIQWLGIALIANIALLGLSLFLTGGIRTFNFKAGVIEASVNEDGKLEVETDIEPITPSSRDVM